MRPIDYLKALAVAVGLMAVNILIAIFAVFVYSIFIDPGHQHEYYQAAAPKIVRWPVHIVGTAFFFIAGYLFVRRRPERNGLLFAAGFAGLYMIVDGAIVGFQGIWNVEFALSMLANLAAAMLGGFIGSRGRTKTIQQATQLSE